MNLLWGFLGWGADFFLKWIGILEGKKTEVVVNEAPAHYAPSSNTVLDSLGLPTTKGNGEVRGSGDGESTSATGREGQPKDQS